MTDHHALTTADPLGALPSNWIGLAAVALIVGIPAAVTVWTTVRNRSKLTDVKAGVEQVQDQVTNNHKTNLRDDITRALSLLELQRAYMEEALPKRSDFDRLSRKVDALERKFEERTCKHFPQEP